jgi:SAM-dependent methyltransferase
MPLQFSLFDYHRPETSGTIPEPSRKTEEKSVLRYVSDYKVRSFYDAPQLAGTHEERLSQNSESLRSNDPVFIYRNYTGIGGLHGIEFKDFGNFHDYTKAKQEYEMGQFFTPSETARLIVEMLEIEPGKKVADICCGMGQFFNHLKGCELHGIEIEDNAFQIDRKLYPHASIEHRDMRYMRSIPPQDYIVGNPPFNLVWEDKTNPLRSSADKVVSQDFYVYQCHTVLKEGGFLAFICPATWLNDELRCGKVNAFLKEHFVKMFEIMLPDDIFSSAGVKHFPTKILGFQKIIPGQEIRYHEFVSRYENALAAWRNSDTYQQFRENKRLAFRYQSAQKYRYHFEKQAESEKELEWDRKYRKLLYELKRIKPEFVEKAVTQRSEIGKAVKPKDMEWQEWESKKPTMERLIRKMKRWLSRKSPENLIRLVKTRNQIKLKGYSRIATQAMNAIAIPKVWEIPKLINRDYWKEEWQSFQKALERLKGISITYRTKEKCVPIPFQNFFARTYFGKKYRKFLKLRADISSLPVPSHIQERLESMRLGDKKLLPHQIEDIGKALLKPSALLNWEMGTGKTFSAIAWSKMKGGRTLVVAPSLLIRKTWQEELKNIGEKNYRIIESMSDVYVSGETAYFLISLERIPKYYKRLKKLRFSNLIVDESDNIKNRSGQRTKALMAVGRRIKNKLILTGTFTRNNATEAYSQIELLLNNSSAMLCEVPEIEEYDRMEKDYVKKPNPIYQLPYPAYSGSAIFRKNFSPKKTTVFGASKTNQELYNKTALEKLLKTVRLRRRFNDIKPKDVTYDIRQITVPMNPAEIRVYNYIFEDFVQTVRKMYEQEHDGKVAGMLVIMTQIMALLQGVSHPWTFPQYDGSEITSKMGRVIEIVRSNPGKKIMFGSPWKPTAKKYAEILSRDFRVVHLESEFSIPKRNQMIQEFREGDSQVLISTIGVLKAGVNIPEAKIVITDSYPWNYAQLSQYFFRAIRLNARNHTQVYCLSNEGSFDTNVFSLMLAKEKVNTFIADSIEVDTKTIAGGFGVNEDMLKCAIQMTKEKMDGKTCSTITWGDSVVSDARARAET